MEQFYSFIYLCIVVRKYFIVRKRISYIGWRWLENECDLFQMSFVFPFLHDLWLQLSVWYWMQFCARWGDEWLQGVLIGAGEVGHGMMQLM
jgi:hypothetical protein